MLNTPQLINVEEIYQNTYGDGKNIDPCTLFNVEDFFKECDKVEASRIQQQQQQLELGNDQSDKVEMIDREEQERRQEKIKVINRHRYKFNQCDKFAVGAKPISYNLSHSTTCKQRIRNAFTNPKYNRLPKTLTRSDLYYLAWTLVTEFFLHSAHTRYLTQSNRLWVRFMWDALLPSRFKALMEDPRKRKIFIDNPNSQRAFDLVSNYFDIPGTMLELSDFIHANLSKIRCIMTINAPLVYYDNITDGIIQKEALLNKISDWNYSNTSEFVIPHRLLQQHTSEQRKDSYEKERDNYLRYLKEADQRREGIDAANNLVNMKEQVDKRIVVEEPPKEVQKEVEKELPKLPPKQTLPPTKQSKMAKSKREVKVVEEKPKEKPKEVIEVRDDAKDKTDSAPPRKIKKKIIKKQRIVPYKSQREKDV